MTTDAAAAETREQAGSEAVETTSEGGTVNGEAAPSKKRTRKKTTKKTSKKSTSKKAVSDASDDAPAAASKPASSKKKKKTTKKKAAGKSEAKADSKPSGTKSASKAGAGDEKKPQVRMVVNYVPGDECRIALVEDGKLEEYDAERSDEVSRVNNIYLGRVTNVEPAIQAAFVDFGIGENGFLHISDLHPRYFDGSDETEKVGRKTPRRERPPIQEALKKGQQILVQVIKEGVGTKGPTLTSYLSIPGRYLVMMPQMDKVGVSRKVEDDDRRRKMREILDQLELPEGFGFILRTAGMDKTKTELKRDLAYLQRLWKDIDRRHKTAGGKPRLLYAESDLLVRLLRDQLTTDIDEVVIDHPMALERAARFMKIVSPRSAVKLMRYSGESPIFHAFGVEEQVLGMHAREVPLPSGGRLVIDETEALVAIDVNSGRSRSARDAETNAYETNLEAADEICRQLRLRDLGGLVILDLIDMRHLKHRRAIEQRFRDRLKRDRAKSTTLAISEFGIMEMTRQRMRGSHERQHFTECTACRGRGLLQKPQSVAADALRELAALLAHERISKAEMVVHPRIAGALLSVKRRTLTRIERTTGKRVDVRVSEAAPQDRASFYAYDDTGADIAIDKLPRGKSKPLIEAWEPDGAGEDWAGDPAAEAEELRQREAELADAEIREQELAETEAMPLPGEDDGSESGEGEGGKKKRKRRRRKRGRGGEGSGEGAASENTLSESDSHEESGEERPASPDRVDENDDDDDSGGVKKKRKRRRRRRGGKKDGDAAENGVSSDGESREAGSDSGGDSSDSGGQSAVDVEAKPSKPKRSLYGSSRRKLSPSELKRPQRDR